MPRLTFPRLTFSEQRFPRARFRARCAVCLLAAVLLAGLAFAPAAQALPKVASYVLSVGALSDTYTSGKPSQGYTITLPNAAQSITITAHPVVTGALSFASGVCLRMQISGGGSGGNEHSKSDPRECTSALTATFTLVIGENTVYVERRTGFAREWDSVNRDIFTIIRQTLPAPPGNLRVTFPADTPAGVGILNAAWTTPPTGASEAPAGYRIRWAEGAASTTWLNPAAEAGESINNAATLAYEISGLQPLTTYAVQVASANTDDRVGVWSASVSARTISAPPAAPSEIVLADASNLGEMHVAWTAAPDPGEAPVTEYRVRWRSAMSANAAAGDWQKAGGATSGNADGETIARAPTAYIITSLVIGMTYEAQVAARNTLGQSPWSAIFTGIPVALPPAPALLPPDPQDRALGLDWTPPPDPPGAPVSSHRVRWRMAAAGDWQKDGSATSDDDDGEEIALPGASYTISGLMNLVSYDVEVAAISAAGRGAWASARAIPSSLRLPQPNLRYHSGTAVSETLVSVTGGMAPYEYTLTGIPAGFAFDDAANTRLLSSGVTPILSAPVTHELVYTVVDSDTPPVTAIRTFTLTLAPPLAFGAVPASLTFRLNAPVNNILPEPIGGFAPFVYSIDTPPFGLSFNAATHAILGMPDSPGSAEIVYTVTDDIGVVVRATIGIHVQAVRPAAPANLRAVAADRQLRLMWSAPRSVGLGGQAPSSYRARWALSSAAANWLNPGGADGADIGDVTAYTITGLTNAMEYNWQVAAVNSAGRGAWSSLGSDTPVPPPAAPVDLRAVAGDRQLQAMWSAPGGSGSEAPSGYLMRWARSNAAADWLNPGGEDGKEVGDVTTYTITELMNGVEYNWQVAAVNGASIGEWSIVDSETPLPPLPAAPGNLSARAVDRQLLLMWSAPGTSAGGEMPSGYRARWALGSAPAAWLNDGGGDGADLGDVTEYAITGLMNGVEYNWQVAAVNSAGRGAWSVLRGDTPLAGLFFLTSPQDLTFTVTGDPVASPAFPVANGGAAPFDYALQGDLPGGLSFDAAARTLSGTPSTTGMPAVDATPLMETATLTYAVSDSASGTITETFRISVIAHAFALDINADGKIIGHDGILIARYMLGVRAAALTDPQRDVDAEVVASRAADGVRAGNLDVDGDGEMNGEDGIMLTRYLLGLRGAALTDGLAATDHAAVETNMRMLLNP